VCWVERERKKEKGKLWIYFRCGDENLILELRESEKEEIYPWIVGDRQFRIWADKREKALNVLKFIFPRAYVFEQ
jgi:hypothetical protein